ncbi:MAG: damage-inducible protein DinB [Sphingobacteriales bacterium]|nr:MAG: damage-inducible protein DinB [Sphingobacteriales bacterium]
MNQEAATTAPAFITPDALMYMWNGHRGLTRRVIDAFPEDKLFNYQIGGMRTFADMARELMALAANGVEGMVTGQFKGIEELDYHNGDQKATTKEALLKQWDESTERMNKAWEQMPAERFTEMVNGFNQYNMPGFGFILYLIDNENHHRGEGYVYLRSLGIEPPPFWDRF